MADETGSYFGPGHFQKKCQKAAPIYPCKIKVDGPTEPELISEATQLFGATKLFKSLFIMNNSRQLTEDSDATPLREQA